MSQEEYRSEGRQSTQSRSGHGGRRVIPSHPEGERRFALRRRKRRLGDWGVLLHVISVLGTSALLAGVGQIRVSDVLALSKSIFTAMVEIDEGDAVGQVAGELEEQGLIEYKMVFKLLCPLTHTSDKAGGEGIKITPGTYELNTDTDYRALISSMDSSSANRMTTIVTISEGMTETQIFVLLEERGVPTMEQLEEATANHDFKFSFPKGVVLLGDPKRLEDYLFFDTYELYMGGEPVSVFNKMILHFNEIFTDGVCQEVQNDDRTIQDAVTVTSAIEKETDGFDQAKITSVIYSRLDNPISEATGYLDIDATAPYATGNTEVGLNVDTPYSIRIHKGFTPMTTANSGVDALKAAVYPDSTRYYFHALGDNEKYHFFAIYREQQNFIALQEWYQNG